MSKNQGFTPPVWNWIRKKCNVSQLFSDGSFPLWYVSEPIVELYRCVRYKSTLYCITATCGGTAAHFFTFKGRTQWRGTHAWTKSYFFYASNKLYVRWIRTRRLFCRARSIHCACTEKIKYYCCPSLHTPRSCFIATRTRGLLTVALTLFGTVLVDHAS